jgi:FMN-dependent NADH-azoreductase
MSHILVVTSSPRGEASYSNRVAAHLLSELQQTQAEATVTVRDLARDALSPIDEDFVAATRSPEGPRTERQRAIAARSDALVDELLAAEIVVIASPMINFTVPSALKTWIDYICRAGRTFRYSESGPKGLATGKRVYLIAARGGFYAASANQAADFQVPYLIHLLAFLGMTDVTVIAIEGTAFGPEAAEKAVAGAVAQVRTLVGEQLAA